MGGHLAVEFEGVEEVVDDVELRVRVCVEVLLAGVAPNREVAQGEADLVAGAMVLKHVFGGISPAVDLEALEAHPVLVHGAAPFVGALGIRLDLGGWLAAREARVEMGARQVEERGEVLKILLVFLATEGGGGQGGCRALLVLLLLFIVVVIAAVNAVFLLVVFFTSVRSSPRLTPPAEAFQVSEIKGGGEA